MNGLVQDFRYALRQLHKSPGFAAVVIITLALGIGANTVIFSVVNTVLLKPLPFKNPAALVRIWGANPGKGVDVDDFSAPDFRDFRGQSHLFEEIGSSTDQIYNLTNAGDPESLPGYQLSANFFHLLGANPILGRTFSEGEDSAGHDRVVVLSHRLWQRSFAGNPAILGKTITLNGEPYTVIGVMRPDFYYPVRDNELWTPLAIPPRAANDRNLRFLRVLARLKPRVSLHQAQAESQTIAAQIAARHPATNAGQIVQLASLVKESTSDIRPAMLALMGAVGFVLLIACANVANLLLARSANRRGEMAVRAALGASQTRLIQQYLTESILLSLLGGALGIVLASFSVPALVRMFPRTISNLNIPRVESIPIDFKVLEFAVIISLLTGILFGLAPALRSRVNLRQSLQEWSRGLRGTRNLYRNALVVSEVALSLVLLVGAGLLIKSFTELIGRSLGFNAQGLLTFRVILPETKYATPIRQQNFAAQVLDQMRSLPGVRSAGTVTFLPLSGWYGVRTLTIAGRSNTGNSGPPVVWSGISPDYFHTMEIALRRGRDFTEQDTAKSQPVAIISQATAHLYWPNENPIGAHITLRYGSAPREIVGIVDDVRHFGATGEPTAEVYLPAAQAPGALICFALRTSSPNPLTLATAVQKAVWEIDKDQPVSHVMSMDQLVGESMAPQRSLTLLLANFAGLSLVLAIVGVYGVMAYSVVERTHEIGIRMALGARRPEVLQLVIMNGLVLTFVGIALGMAGAWGLTRFLSSLLYGVKPGDPSTFFEVSALLAVVAGLASYLPARRAAKVDPMVALHYE